MITAGDGVLDTGMKKKSKEMKMKKRP